MVYLYKGSNKTKQTTNKAVKIMKKAENTLNKIMTFLNLGACALSGLIALIAYNLSIYNQGFMVINVLFIMSMFAFAAIGLMYANKVTD